MRLGKACAAAAFSALAILSSPAEAKKPRDDFFNPQPPGTYLRLFGFFGPGFRGILDNRIALEPDMSELQTQLIADVNPGFSEASLNADVRVFLLSFGAGVGYRNDWHTLQFSPDGSCESGEICDHGSTELDRESRWSKDHDYDWGVKRWPWFEGRFRIVAPMYQFMGVSTTQFRYQARGFASCDEVGNPDCIDQRTVFDWATSTVFRDGFIVVNETFLVLRDRDMGFIGPALRVLNVPRGINEGHEEREWEFHYGVLAGAQVGPGNRDTVLLRVYTTLGQDEGLFGTQAFRAPIQIVFGYQANILLF
jgi:hypothetical protein